MRRPSLLTLLAVELPFLLVGLGLMSWGLYAFVDAGRFNRLSGTQKGFESGDYGFNYGTQVVTLTSTRTVLTGQTVLATPTVLTYTLYPYAQGTIAYTSLYSRLGYIPTPVTSFSPTTYTSTRTSDGATFLTTRQIAERRDAVPTPTSAPLVLHKRATWVDNSASRSGGLYNVYSDARSFLDVMVLCFALVVAFQAVRVLATAAYILIFFVRPNSNRARKGALIMLVTVTTLSWLAITAPGIAAFSMFGDWYAELFNASPGVQATLAFYSVNVVTTFVVLVSSCVAIHRLKRKMRQEDGYVRKEEGTPTSRTSRSSV